MFYKIKDFLFATFWSSSHILLCIYSLVCIVSCKSPNIPPATNEFDICNNIDSLNKAIENDSTNGQYFSCRAALLYNSGMYYKALYDISMAIYINGANIPDLLLLSDIYFVMNNTEMSLKSLLSALSLDENDYSVYYALGKYYYLINNYDVSKGYLMKAIELNPTSHYPFCLLGEINLMKGDTISSVNNFHRAIQIDKGFLPAYMHLATISLIQNSSMTPQYLRSALSIDSNNCDALYLSGVYYQQNNQFRLAINYYTKVYNICSDYTMAFYNAGYIFLAEYNVFDTAIIWFNRTIEIDTTFYDAYYNRAYSLQLQGNISAAKNEYRKLLNRKPDYIMAKQRLEEI